MKDLRETVLMNIDNVIQPLISTAQTFSGKSEMRLN
jgi:hypothetical protein